MKIFESYYTPETVLVLPKNVPAPEFEYPVLDVDVTSHSHSAPYRELSPFFLGECELADGRVAKNMENAWQYSKVYAEHVNRTSNVTKQWKEWSSKGFASKRADRYPMGKGAVPLFSLHGSERLSYVEARKRMYIPMYAKLAVQVRAFHVMRELYQEQETKIIIRDFDAYDHRAHRMSWDKVIHNERRKMGHGFVLAMMLELGENFYRMFE